MLEIGKEQILKNSQNPEKPIKIKILHITLLTKKKLLA